MTIQTSQQRRLRRRRRVRARITGTAERPRLSVYRSNKGVFAQLIDDRQGHTLAAVNWIEPDLKSLTASAQLIDDRQGHTLAAVNWIEPDLKSLTASAQATKAGELLAERAKAAGIET